MVGGTVDLDVNLAVEEGEVEPTAAAGMLGQGREAEFAEGGFEDGLAGAGLGGGGWFAVGARGGEFGEEGRGGGLGAGAVADDKAADAGARDGDVVDVGVAGVGGVPQLAVGGARVEAEEEDCCCLRIARTARA